MIVIDSNEVMLVSKHKRFPFIKPNMKNISFLDEVDSEEEDVREVIVETKSGFNTLEVLVIVIISIIFGIAVGSSLSIFRQEYRGEKVSNSLQELITVYQDILDTYYKDIDEADLVDAAVDGMLSSLDDPYSTYMDEDSATTFNETVDGSYVGIGVTIHIKDTGEVTVIGVTKNSPADEANIKEGDIILSLDGKSVSGLSLEEISSIVKGDSNSKLKMVLERDNEEITKTVTRGTVDMVSVTSDVFRMEQSKVGYISISSFAANTYKQFKKELKTVEKKNINSLVLDVRSNPGGHLSQTRDILELFLKKNQVLYQVEFKGKVTKIKDKTKTSRNYPIVVLINSSSASAAEILASAFQDSYPNAILLGEKTYGKGTIQTAYSLSDGSTLKYTTDKWLTPNGKSIDGKGVSPDEVVLLTTEYFKNPTVENDLQLQTALSILEKKTTNSD